jgi:hypothetical protein
MSNLRCPGMDPAFFKPEDIRMLACPRCGAEQEFWKDDVYQTCAQCGRRNLNPMLKNSCAAWCAKAAECLGNEDIRSAMAKRDTCPEALDPPPAIWPPNIKPDIR